MNSSITPNRASVSAFREGMPQKRQTRHQLPRKQLAQKPPTQPRRSDSFRSRCLGQNLSKKTRGQNDSLASQDRATWQCPLARHLLFGATPAEIEAAIERSSFSRLRAQVSAEIRPNEPNSTMISILGRRLRDEICLDLPSGGLLRAGPRYVNRATARTSRFRSGARFAIVNWGRSRNVDHRGNR